MLLIKVQRPYLFGVKDYFFSSSFKLGSVKLQSDMGYIALFLLGILGITNAQNFYVAVPSTLRLDTDEVIGIAVDFSEAVLVNVEVRDHPGNEKNIFQSSFIAKPGKPKKIRIMLDVKEIPPQFLTAPGSRKYVALRVSIRNETKEVTKEVLIPITSQYGHIFIYSDKPIYRPIERASFRIITLTEEGTPSFEQFIFQIKNPDGIVVGEKSFAGRRRSLVYYFETYYYAFPKYPKLGEWTAVVRYGNNYELNSTMTFELEEYVLPTFIVNITTPDIIIPTDEIIDITVEAKHTYGKVVSGHVYFRFGVKEKHSSYVTYFFILNHPKLINDGIAHVHIMTKELERHPEIEWFPRIEGSTFVVEVTVVDDATGNKVVEVDSKCRFSKTPFHISLKRCLRDFKPGLITVFEADISYVSGRPASGVLTKLTATADNMYPLHVVKSSTSTDEYGRVTFEIHTEMHHTEINLTLETEDKQYGVDQAIGICVQRSYQSRSKAYVAISRISQSDLRPNDVFRRDIHLEPSQIKDIYYLVVARGRIQKFEKLSVGVYKVRHISFSITHKMVPYFRFIVFAHYENELLVDSLKIDVDKVCSPEAEVKLETEFYDEEPGSLGKIFLRGREGTSVGLFVVDKSVYAMSRSNILRREKIFDELGNSDLGCGPGGGLTVNSILGNAGIMLITNKFSSSDSDSCGGIQRKKRSATEYIGRQIRENFDDMEILEPDLIHEIESYTTVREDFRETILSIDDIIGSQNITEVRINLPHSITTWIIQAVSVSPTHGVCVSDHKTIVSFKKVFLHLSLPYSIKQYELVEINATVFNYGGRPLIAYVYMYKTPGICAPTGLDNKREMKVLYIDAKSAQTVNFPIVPLLNETIPIKFVVVSVEGSDVVNKELHVVPRQGIAIVRRRNKAVIKLDPSNRQNRNSKHIKEILYADVIHTSKNLQVTSFNLTTPNEVVAGSAICTITVTGDAVEPVVETSLKNPDELIKLPTGYGEQNMMRLAPTIFTLRYLEYTKKSTPAQKEKAFQFIRTGYSNELRFKEEDGSYSIWAHTIGSTWLTAFVTKVFCHGTKLIPLDDKVLTSGVQWLLNNQQPDGSYVEENILYHRSIMDGIDGIASMTAFALISLEECNIEEEKLSEAREKARKYLETHSNIVETPWSAAIVAYALALTNSTEKISANERLLLMAKYEHDKNYMYWQTKPYSHDIETAGYALLTQLQLNDLYRSTCIVNWLNTQQLKTGEFESTQDTVLALQALSEYAIKAPNISVSLVSEVIASSDENFTKVFISNNTNAIERQSITITNPEGKLYIKTSGYGAGTLTMQLEYKVYKPEHEICKFYIKETITEIENVEPLIREVQSVLSASERPYDELVYKIKICIRYLGDAPARTSIADVGIFPGFIAYMHDLEKLQKDPDHLIQKFEKSNRNIVFYLESVPITEDYCFSFRIIRDFIVRNTQSSVIKVYDYFNPDAVCTRFYSSHSDALVRLICTGDTCLCAEGGCPARTFPDDVLKIRNTADRRDKITELFCADFDYVWLGTLDSQIVRKDGYKRIPFKITEVFKEGAEAKGSIVNQTRILLAHEYCESADILAGFNYLITGKDHLIDDAGDGALNGYLLNERSIIHHWVEVKYSTKKELQRDLNRVIEFIIEDACG